jgi:nucleoside-diphosphate-sugar epimerase
LVRNGHEVLALARTETSAEELGEAGYEVVRGELRNALTLAQSALNADAVVHSGFSKARDAAAVDTGATTAMTLALERSERPFLYTSATWVYGNSARRTVREDTPRHPPPGWAWLVNVEDMVLGAADRGVGAVVLRPGVVYGNGGGILGRFIREAQTRGVVRVVGDGKQRWPFVHRHDLADLFVKALQAAPGSVFNGTAGASAPLKEVARIVGSMGGGSAKVVNWPLREARKELGAFADAMALDQAHVSSEKAASELDWRPRKSPVLSEVLPANTQGAVR